MSRRPTTVRKRTIHQIQTNMFQSNAFETEQEWSHFHDELRVKKSNTCKTKSPIQQFLKLIKHILLAISTGLKEISVYEGKKLSRKNET